MALSSTRSYPPPVAKASPVPRILRLAQFLAMSPPRDPDWAVTRLASIARTTSTVSQDFSAWDLNCFRRCITTPVPISHVADLSPSRLWKISTVGLQNSIQSLGWTQEQKLGDLFQFGVKPSAPSSGQFGACKPPVVGIAPQVISGEHSTTRPRCRSRLLLEGARLRGRSSRVSRKGRDHVYG